MRTVVDPFGNGVGGWTAGGGNEHVCMSPTTAAGIAGDQHGRDAGAGDDAGMAGRIADAGGGRHQLICTTAPRTVHAPDAASVAVPWASMSTLVAWSFSDCACSVIVVWALSVTEPSVFSVNFEAPCPAVSSILSGRDFDLLARSRS